MKIYEKIVIDMGSGETISEISYNYNGSLALCGSSGGGGGSSGKVSYAQFMEDRLEIMLDACIVDTDTARAGNSPFFAAAAYNPSTPLAAMNTSNVAFNALIDALITSVDAPSVLMTDMTTALSEISAILGSIVPTTSWASLATQAKTTIESLYDPTTQLTTMNTAICAFNTVVDALNSEGDWASAVAQAKTTVDALIDDTYINAEVASFAEVVDDQVDNITIPKFQRGMQDINAVQSSSYVLGEALIYGMRDRDVAKYQSELRMKAVFQRNEMIMKGSSEIIHSLLQRVEFEKKVTDAVLTYNSKHIDTKIDINKMIVAAASVMTEILLKQSEYELRYTDLAVKTGNIMLQFSLSQADLKKMALHYNLEYNRMFIAATKDKEDRDIQFDELDARWDLEMWQYSANVLASIAGGVAISPSGNRPSQTQSAIGGALSGAAAGAMAAAPTAMGAPVGAAIGGVLGLASSFL